jgi:hypothetical protein
VKKIFFSFLLILIFLFPLGLVFAEDYGLEETVSEGNLSDALNTGDTDIASKVGKLIGVVLSFVGVIFFILVIYGGFLWMTARGDSGQVEKAKDLLYAAAIGLIIVLSAYAITAFIGTQITAS